MVNLSYLVEGYIFARKNDTYVSMAVKSNGEGKLMFKNDMEGVTQEELEKDFNAIKSSVKELIETTSDHRYDLIYTGGDAHAWVSELSSIEEDGSFAHFVNRILSNSYAFIDNNVTYVSNEKVFDVKYDTHFKLTGKDVDVEYERFESDYVENNVTYRKTDEIKFAFNNKTLTLNFKELKREW